MPKRVDIHKILIIGAGPIVIGQACEFDYSGTQACKSLREEGFEVVLVNSNPATIMTDPQMADRTYIEPITVEVVDQILGIEKPHAVLPESWEDKTGLNVALALYGQERWERHGCILIGRRRRGHPGAPKIESFPSVAWTKSARYALEAALAAHNLDEARQIREEIGSPGVFSDHGTLGGSGGGIAYNREVSSTECMPPLSNSARSILVLIEESMIGWKEFEMEVGATAPTMR